MVDERCVVRYSQAFKRQVVQELEAGVFANVNQARLHYGIQSTSTIYQWVRRMGRHDLLAKVVRVEQPEEQREVERLRRQVRELEHALAQTHMKELLAQAQFDLLCEAQGLDAQAQKKSIAAQLSGRHPSDPGERESRG